MKHVRVYDKPDCADRYTVVFGGRYRKVSHEFHYLGMSENPFHPQGIGMHGETVLRPADANGWGFIPAMGRSCHLGKRIPFESLPAECQKLAKQTYMEIWK